MRFTGIAASVGVEEGPRYHSVPLEAQGMTLLSA